MYVRVLTATMLATAASHAHAQQLDAFLQETLTSDPEIAGADALVRAAEAGVDIDRSVRLPTMALDAMAQVQTSSRLYGARRPATLNLGINLDLPLYTGGEVTWRIRSSVAALEAERARRDTLVNTRLANTAVRYASVYRDERIEAARLSQVSDVEILLTATRARERAGASTSTDTLQTIARLAGARARLSEARALLIRSNEDLREITGKYVDAADDPEPPIVPARIITGLPDHVATFPAIRVTEALIAKARADVLVARSARMPRLYLSGMMQTGNDVTQGNVNLSMFRTGMQIGFTFRIPLFQGGAVGARVRQAQQILASRREDREAAERQTVAQIRSQYAQLNALDAALPALAQAITASRAALFGVQAEIKIGARSSLDVLNAQAEVTQVEIQLAQVRQQRLALAYSILGTMGELNAGKIARDQARTAQPVGTAAALMPVATFDKLGLWVWKGSRTWSLKPGHRTLQIV